MIPEETSVPRPPFLNRISARQRVSIDAVIGLLLFAGGLSGLVTNHNGGRLPQHFALLLIALGLATLPLPFRRRSPVPVLVLVVAGLLVGTLLKQGLAGTPVVAMAIFSVATQLRRRDSLIAALVTVLAFVIALAIAGFHASHGGDTARYDATDNLIAIAVAWFIGDSIRARRAYVAGSVLQAEQRQRIEVERAQISLTEERLHIARELHDIVAHTLSVIAIQSGVGRHVLDTQPEEARKALAAIETTSRSALNDLRWVLGVLRSDDGEKPIRGPAPGLSDVERLLGECRAAGLDVSFTQCGEARPLSPSMELCLYRIIQEALTNVTKHAATAHASVAVNYGGEAVVVSITDEGPLHRKGVVLRLDSDRDSRSHHGIVGMRERTAIYGGTLIAQPRLGGGFEVHARLPTASALP
jgi:signal transduction histidine kinase